MLGILAQKKTDTTPIEPKTSSPLNNDKEQYSINTNYMIDYNWSQGGPIAT